jgi:hypothetical protein
MALSPYCLNMTAQADNQLSFCQYLISWYLNVRDQAVLIYLLAKGYCLSLFNYQRWFLVRQDDQRISFAIVIAIIGKTDTIAESLQIAYLKDT